MPVNAIKAGAVWARYRYLRDNGHNDYLAKATRADEFFRGVQWDKADLAYLRSVRRPALTINKILSTISNVMGEQIYNRSEIAFRPRSEEANAEVADALTKVFMQVSDDNQLPWVRSDVFADGVITSRGFYQVTVDFEDNVRGEVRVHQLNPRNVLLDNDAHEYDPKTWSDVLYTSLMSPHQIEMMWGPAAAKHLGRKPITEFGEDEVIERNDRFGNSSWESLGNIQAGDENREKVRDIRVLYYEHRKPVKIEHFVDVMRGDTRQVPSDWNEERINAYLAQNPTVSIQRKLVYKIRWTVVAGDYVLHDDWSPYDNFTIVPYFPHFRHGQTIGLVENLLDPQMLLNKTRSQELHVINTTANSGWKVKAGSMMNMSLAELEQRGAQTGLVLELKEIADAEKILPNQVPSGLDRIGYLAEESIKSISGVTDYQTGNAREDVSAKALSKNQAASSANLAKPLDNLNRSDALLAKVILDCVQKFYTEERLIRLTGSGPQELRVNQLTPEGMILNDLTLGEYQVIVTSQPERESYEDTQFDQVVMMRKELGIKIPDSVVIDASRLRDKTKIKEAMDAVNKAPEAEAARQLDMRGKAAEVAKTEADAQYTMAQAQTELQGSGKDSFEAKMIELEKEHEFNMKKLQLEMQIKREQVMLEMRLEEEKAQREMAREDERMRRDTTTARIAAANKPAPTTTNKAQGTPA